MNDGNRLDLVRRPRRLRTTASVRAMVRETRLGVDDLIAPLFVHDRHEKKEAVESMPGVFRFPEAAVVDQCRNLASLGLKAVALFPCIRSELKDEEGSVALDSENLNLRTIRAIKKALPELVVIADVALDPYTSHGHDGIIDAKTGDVDNDLTVEILSRLAVLEAEAGADWVAPSDMMDGRVAAIRDALDQHGLIRTAILAYAAKFASSYYGPFREAVGSDKAAGKSYLDKGTYQMNPANAREAVYDALLDEDEGADLLMVKPAGPYLDIIRRLRDTTELPVVAYQVSGEYSQIQAAARLGWLDLDRARDEALMAIKRAGADLVITYFAEEVARRLAE